MAFLTHSQVELTHLREGFWHKAWISLISWIRFRLRKSNARIYPLTFSLQSVRKNKNVFSQENTVINIASSCSRFLVEMHLQVLFYESSSFSKLFFFLTCCYRPLGMNVQVKGCSWDLHMLQLQCLAKAEFWSFCFWEVLQKFTTPSPKLSLQYKHSHTSSSWGFTMLYFKGQHKSKTIILEKAEPIWVKEQSLIWPTLITGCCLTLKEKKIYIVCMCTHTHNIYIYIVRSCDELADLETPLTVEVLKSFYTVVNGTEKILSIC